MLLRIMYKLQVSVLQRVISAIDPDVDWTSEFNTMSLHLLFRNTNSHDLI